jgi:hypothetical protein
VKNDRFPPPRLGDVQQSHFVFIFIYEKLLRTRQLFDSPTSFSEIICRSININFTAKASPQTSVKYLLEKANNMPATRAATTVLFRTVL